MANMLKNSFLCFGADFFASFNHTKVFANGFISKDTLEVSSDSLAGTVTINNHVCGVVSDELNMPPKSLHDVVFFPRISSYPVMGNHINHPVINDRKTVIIQNMNLLFTVAVPAELSQSELVYASETRSGVFNDKEVFSTEFETNDSAADTMAFHF